MRRVAMSIVVSCFSFLAVPAIFAEHPKIDFDQEVNASDTLGRARENAGVIVPRLRSIRRRIQLPFEPQHSSGLPRRDSLPPRDASKAVDLPNALEACQKWDPGQDGAGSSVSANCLAPEQVKGAKDGEAINISLRTGPYQPLPINNASYHAARTYPPKLQNLPPPVREPLLRDFNEIETIRTGLIKEGGDLDVEDEKVDFEARRLQVWSRRIDDRGAILDAQLAQYNQQCRSGPLPPNDVTACRNWARVFNGCVDRHNASVDRFNPAATAWRESLKRIQTLGGAFKAKVQNWDDFKIKPFMERAKKALEEGCEPVKSVKMIPRGPITLKTRGDTLPMRGFAIFDGDNPCPIKNYDWQKANGTGDIGRLLEDSVDPSLATLTTGPGEASGAAVLNVRDSKGNLAQGAVVISVLDTVRTCELNRLASHPINQNVCTYICSNSNPTGPLDQYGIPDPNDPSGMRCRPYILEP